jgi:integrase/recombinase XerD
LRHSFASHLLAEGFDIYVIKRLLGHTSIKTTCAYLHLDPDYLKTIRSPLDLLMKGNEEVRS